MRPRQPSNRGFTLIEVLVTLVVLSLAMLGVTGLQATVLADTQNASLRGLVALQATSLANRMHSNRAYWAQATAPISFDVSDARVTDPSGQLSMPGGTSGDPCTASGPVTAALCTPQQMAATDLQAWARAASRWLPSLSAQGRCEGDPGPARHCTLTLHWTERHVATIGAANPGTNVDSIATSGVRDYTLYVTP